MITVAVEYLGSFNTKNDKFITEIGDLFDGRVIERDSFMGVQGVILEFKDTAEIPTFVDETVGDFMRLMSMFSRYQTTVVDSDIM
jgi:hypothetical protein